MHSTRLSATAAIRGGAIATALSLGISCRDVAPTATTPILSSSIRNTPGSRDEASAADSTRTAAAFDLTLSPDTAQCFTGATVPLTAKIARSADDSAASVVFSTTSASIALTWEGDRATVSCLSHGTASVSATAAVGADSATARATIAVVSPVSGVSVTPVAVGLAPGGTASIRSGVALRTGAPTTTSTGVRILSSDTAVVRVTAALDGSAVITAAPNAANVGRQAVVTAFSLADPDAIATTVVTITSPNALVQAVTVASAKALLELGDQVQLAPRVTLAPSAPAGTSTDVTYRSANALVASVDGRGTVTAVRAGSTIITVASVAAPTVAASVNVIVNASEPTAPTPDASGAYAIPETGPSGTYRLSALNVDGRPVAETSTPVSGKTVLALKLIAGDARTDSVVATLGGARYPCPHLATGSMRIACEVNTAAFDTASGAPQARNGGARLAATAYYHFADGIARTQRLVGDDIPLLVFNRSGYYVDVGGIASAAQRANGGTGQAMDVRGKLWTSGSLRVAVVAVDYGQGLGSGAPSIALQDDVNGSSVSVVATRTTGTAYVATFRGTTAAYTAQLGASTLDGYSSPATGPSGGGTHVRIAGLSNATLLAADGAVLGGSGATVFIDNAAPEALQTSVSPSSLSISYDYTGTPLLASAFVNASTPLPGAFVTGTPSTPFGDYDGVGRVARSFYYAVSTGASSPPPSAIVAGGRSATVGAQVTALACCTFYVGAVDYVDALGNATALPLTTTAASFATPGQPLVIVPVRFNVDFSPPVVSLAIPVGGTYTSHPQIFASLQDDKGFGPDPLRVTGVVATSAGGFACPVRGANGDLTGYAPSASASCPALDIAFFNVQGSTPPGRYTLTVTPRDQAGNVGAPLTVAFTIQ